MGFYEELDDLITKHVEAGEDLDKIISDLELKLMALQEEQESWP